jgi:hypothetical protein
MIAEHATAADFAKWRAHAESCDSASLHYIIADCRRAAAAMKGWNPNREGFYIDQLCTYADERRRRQAA